MNHIGDDISRGLLTFAERKTLGERGLFWLKVHLANKAGFDKASLEERLAFTEEHIQDIYDSADHPLEVSAALSWPSCAYIFSDVHTYRINSQGSGWWLKSEDPWQTLAACIEVTEALRSDDPTKYQSYLPVHQDGSCNGLQHYAALGGDVEGGREVNLVPGERPGDVYSKVAAEVNKLVDQDAGNGHDIAKALKGYIKRKVVKQTVSFLFKGVWGETFRILTTMMMIKVMTTVYGKVYHIIHLGTSTLSMEPYRCLLQVSLLWVLANRSDVSLKTSV